MKSDKWGHNELANDLAGHLRGTRDRVVWTDMQLGPQGSPRPDVYTIPKSFSRFTPLAYEVKISVADFRRDVTSGKWQSYLKFAAGVIFAVPAGLIKKEDVPPGCGLIVRHDEIWRTVKGPTLKATDNLPRDTWIKLMIDGLGRQHHEINPRIANQYLIERDIRKKYGDEIAKALSDRNAAVSELQRRTAMIQIELDGEIVRQRENREKARLSAERDAGIVRATRVELAQALGLPGDASIYDIQYAAREAANRLSESDEIKRLQRKFDSIKNAISHADDPVPVIARAA